MSKITREIIEITEQTIKELQRAIEEAKEKHEKSVSEGNDNPDKLNYDWIIVASKYSSIEFKVFCKSQQPNTQESLGYKLVEWWNFRDPYTIRIQCPICDAIIFCSYFEEPHCSLCNWAP